MVLPSTLSMRTDRFWTRANSRETDSTARPSAARRGRRFTSGGKYGVKPRIRLPRDGYNATIQQITSADIHFAHFHRAMRRVFVILTVTMCATGFVYTGLITTMPKLFEAGLGSDLAVSYTGAQEDDYFPPFPPFQERVELNSYTLVSLSGRYQLTDALTLTARLENVTDEEYEQVYGFESPGFGGYVGLRMQW